MAAWEPEDEYRADPITRLMRWFCRWLFPDPKDQKKGWHIGREKDFLCDTCKYNYGSSCSQPERPNVTKCREYKKS